MSCRTADDVLAIVKEKNISFIQFSEVNGIPQSKGDPILRSDYIDRLILL